MAKPPAISLPKVADLAIPEGPIDGKTLKDVFTRYLSQENSFFDQIQKLGSKGITLTENLRADVVTGQFSHGVPQNVSLHTLSKANSAVVLGSDGQIASHNTVQMQQTATGGKPQPQVTIWFNNSAATNVSCTLLLLPEGTQTSTTPTYLEPIPKSTLTTIGDLIYASAASTPARLGVGATGQLLTVSGGLPAWAGDAAWTNISSFSNGWTNFGSTSAPAAYKKEGNRIWVRGGVHNGTINAVGFNLPANYRPQYDLTFMGVSYSSAAGGAGLICPILVQTNGNVTIGNDANGNNFYAEMNFSFDTLS